MVIIDCLYLSSQDVSFFTSNVCFIYSASVWYFEVNFQCIFMVMRLEKIIVKRSLKLEVVNMKIYVKR